MEKLTLNIPAWHKKSCWGWFGGFVLSISLNLFLSWSSLIYEAHDSTLSHIWDCEKHKNWTLSIIKTVLISSEILMTAARIKYHEPEVWDVMPTFLFLFPCVHVYTGSRRSTWDGEDERCELRVRLVTPGSQGVRGYHILHHFIDWRGMHRHLLNSHHYNLSIEARTFECHQ